MMLWIGRPTSSANLTLCLEQTDEESEEPLSSESDSGSVSWVWKEESRLCLGAFFIGEMFEKFGNSCDSISVLLDFLRVMLLFMVVSEEINRAGMFSNSCSLFSVFSSSSLHCFESRKILRGEGKSFLE